MNIKNILLSCVLIFGSLSLSGCYTQLSMFHPETEEYNSYSVAVRVPTSLSIYAQDGAGTPLGMAYQMMYSRFQPFFGFGNRYSYYLMQSGIRSPYYHGGYYSDIGGYTMYIPVAYQQGERKHRSWDRGNTTTNDRATSNLRVTRTRTNINRISDPYPVQDTPRQDTFNSQRSTSSSNSGRVTRRN